MWVFFLDSFSWNSLTRIVVLWTLFTFWCFFFLLRLVVREEKRSPYHESHSGFEIIIFFSSVECSTSYCLVWASRFWKTETTWHLLIMSFGLDYYSSDSVCKNYWDFLGAVSMIGASKDFLICARVYLLLNTSIKPPQRSSLH